jgi:hypothetical protein
MKNTVKWQNQLTLFAQSGEFNVKEQLALDFHQNTTCDICEVRWGFAIKNSKIIKKCLKWTLQNKTCFFAFLFNF